MGIISAHNIEEFKQKYKLDIFIETGTGLGYGLNWALNNSNFKSYFSCEYYEKVFNRTKHCSMVYCMH